MPRAINIDYLATYLPMFTQVFGDFGDNILFNKISIEGASMGITCDVSRPYLFGLEDR